MAENVASTTGAAIPPCPFVNSIKLPYFAGYVISTPLNVSLFIAKKIAGSKKEESFASVIHGIAITSIALGLAASLVSFLILKGFQETVKNKIFNFSGHLLVTRISTDNSMEGRPFNYSPALKKSLMETPGIARVVDYAYKTGLIKTEKEVLGIVYKGIGTGQHLHPDNIREGRGIHYPDAGYSQEIMVSRTMASKLELKVGESIVLHFFQDPPRARRLTIVGIYETNLSEYFDSKVILGDIRLVQRLNDWGEGTTGGLEIYLKTEGSEDVAASSIESALDFDLQIEKVSDKYIQVFEWLGLLSRQVNILLGIILTVVCVNMVSIILILVLERTTMIGILKALGAGNATIRSIFVFRGINFLAKGMAWGNLLALGLCFVQDRFNVIQLNPEDYYMSSVPVNWDWGFILVLNILVFTVVSTVLLLPSMVISRVSPIKAIKFD